MNRASRKPWWAVLGWALACLLWLVTPVQAQQAKEVAVPTLSKRVTDLTSTLDASQQAALETKLAALEQRKGAQVAVLIVPTTGPDTIEQFATRVFDTWKLGRQKVDDGILFVVAKNDHTLRFEVGYGLEGRCPTRWPRASFASRWCRISSGTTTPRALRPEWTP
ncbi:repair family protein [Bordetella holmesii 41130]|nr:repair family protein [Bordetella holmesii 41130]